MSFTYQPLIEDEFVRIPPVTAVQPIRVGLIVNIQDTTSVPTNGESLARATTLSLANFTDTSYWAIAGAGDFIELEYINPTPKTFRFEHVTTIRKANLAPQRIMTIFLAKDGITFPRLASYSYVSTVSTYPDNGGGQTDGITFNQGDTLGLYIRMLGSGPQNYQVSQNVGNVIIYGEEII